MDRASHTFCYPLNPLNGVWRLARRWQRAAAAGQRVRGDLGRQRQSGKGPQRVLCRDEPCFAHVLKPSKWSMATWPRADKGLPLQGNMFAVTWEGSGKGLPLQGNVFAEAVNKIWRRGQAVAQGAAAGQRARGDLGRQWQSGKGPQTGFVSWWAVLRARFETL